MREGVRIGKGKIKLWRLKNKWISGWKNQEKEIIEKTAHRVPKGQKGRSQLTANKKTRTIKTNKKKADQEWGRTLLPNQSRKEAGGELRLAL